MMSSESSSQYDPMYHFVISGITESHIPTVTQLVTSPSHCWFSNQLMQNMSSSKKNTDDYSGHEGDVMHHLLQTNELSAYDETRHGHA